MFMNFTPASSSPWSVTGAAPEVTSWPPTGLATPMSDSRIDLTGPTCLGRSE
jgi:hypothetical protein